MKLPENLPLFTAVTPDEAKEMLCTMEYGYPPKMPDAAEFTVEETDADFCAGKAVRKDVTARVINGDKTFSFPFCAVIPKCDKPVPAVVLVNFHTPVPSKYLPSEEVCDMGTAVFSFDYQAVSPDNDDFESKAGGFLNVDRSDPHAPGKIAIWAWAMRIVMNYVETCPEIDLNNVAAGGHSRLGKTALFAGLHDERFKFVWSNDSGCCGAALFRGKAGESAADIHRVFPFWFCPNFSNYTDSDDAFPFDQHYLLSCIAPRKLYVCSAIEDIWADPQNELAGCIAATPAYEAKGLAGLVGDPENAYAGLVLHDGNIGYHCRSGSHYMGREDWQKFIAFMNKHKN